MLPQDTIAQLARELYDARKSRTQVRHFSQRFPEMSVDDGYAIQRAWVKLELADGRTIKGRKIGLTSRAMQRQLKVDSPDFGHLFTDMVLASGIMSLLTFAPDGTAEDLLAPRVAFFCAGFAGWAQRGG
jgi:2-oxo-hept-3-ene-1,7-dioate hydratase